MFRKIQYKNGQFSCKQTTKRSTLLLYNVQIQIILTIHWRAFKSWLNRRWEVQLTTLHFRATDVTRLWGALVQHNLGALSCEARRAEARSQKGWERGLSEPPPHQLGDLGESCKLPKCSLGRRILMLFVFWDDLSCYGKSCVHCASLSFHSFCHLSCNSNCSSGPLGARGPRFIESPEPPVSTPLGLCKTEESSRIGSTT